MYSTQRIDCAPLILGFPARRKRTKKEGSRQAVWINDTLIYHLSPSPTSSFILSVGPYTGYCFDRIHVPRSWKAPWGRIRERPSSRGGFPLPFSSRGACKSDEMAHVDKVTILGLLNLEVTYCVVSTVA